MSGGSTQPSFLLPRVGAKVWVIGMKKLISIGLLVVGVILIVLGVQGMNSLESDVSRFFRGTPTDKSVWMLIGGILCAIGGAVGLMKKG